MSNNCGIKWPITSPFFGGPYPTRTWFRDNIDKSHIFQQFSLEQLNMRRKAEVLARSNNNLKQHKQTWKERFAYAVRNPSKHITRRCSLVISDSSSSNVPGNLKLFDDPSVPFLNKL